MTCCMFHSSTADRDQATQRIHELTQQLDESTKQLALLDRYVGMWTCMM